MRFLGLASIAAVLFSAACQMMPPPAAPSEGSPETTGAPAEARPAGGGSTAAPSSGVSAPSATRAQGAPVSTTVEIHSDCGKTVPVFYGDKPKFGSGTKSSVSSNSTSSQGRNSDGTLTVWIIDDQENGVASVRVTPGTKRVEIDSSCKRITAR